MRAQNAELLRAFAFERHHGIDHVLDDAGAGDLAVLGDMADQDDGRAGALGEADQFAGRAAHLRHRAGRRFDRLRPHGLDRIDDQKPRRRALRQRRHDVLDRGFGGDLDRGFGKPEPLGAQPHLRHGFFAGNIDGAVLVAREGGRDFEQQRRFADAGIAAEQQHRAAHQPAAGHAVELGDAGRQPRRFMRSRP